MSFLVAPTSLPAVDRPNADRWNAARSCQWIKCLSLVDFTIVKHGQMKSGILLNSRIAQNSLM